MLRVLLAESNVDIPGQGPAPPCRWLSTLVGGYGYAACVRLLFDSRSGSLIVWAAAVRPRRQSADRPDAQGGRSPEARALPVPRPRGVRAVRLGPRPGHAANAGARRAAGRLAEPERALAASDRGPGHPGVRRHERLRG